MKLVTHKQKIPRNELTEMSKKMYGNLVKAVIDVEQEIMMVDAHMHADLEAVLLEKESEQANLWGINLHPDMSDESWVEFDSLINIRPGQNNPSRGVEHPLLRKKIVTLVNNLVTP